MNFIDPKLGELLFEKVEEILQQSGLSEKERIPKYRSILELLFKALTEDAGRYFAGLSARCTYIFKEYQVPRQVSNAVSQLRKYSNSVIHDTEVVPSVEDDARCLFQLSTAIGYFAKMTIPDVVRKSYEYHQSHFQEEKPARKPPLPTYAFRAIVRDVFIPKGDTAKFCALHCDTEELGEITLKFWNNKNENGFGSDLTGIADLVFPYATIYVTDVKPYTEKEGEYYASDTSLVVLEPDYLIEAKDLSDCYQITGTNPLIYLLNRFNQGEITDKVMIGNIVGQLLDDISTEPDYSYNKSFEKVMRVNSFGMLCMANQEGIYNRSAIEAVFSEARIQEGSIKGALERFKGMNLSIEPTFISAKYGLQGRLDMLATAKDDTNRKDIVELKSGRYPQLNGLSALYPNHEAQTICYDLLISSTFPKRNGLSSILYSKAPIVEHPLRNVGEERFMPKQELLMLRNKIVANEIKLAQGDFSPLLAINPSTFGAVPVFQQPLLNDFHQTISGLSPAQRQYFFGFFQFIYRELQAAKIGNNNGMEGRGGFAALWLSSKPEKIENYDVLVYLTVADVSDDFHIRLNVKTDLFSGSVSSLREGEIALLYPTPDPEVLNPLESQILKCTILALTPDYVEISLANKQLDKGYFKQYQFWAIEKDFRESGYKKMLGLLYQFIKSDERIQRLVFGQARPRFDSISSEPIEGLNANQLLAVRKAVATKDYFLIQGPPGTGKTSKVLCEIVRQIAKGNESVMVIAFTNRAVEEIGKKLHAMGLDFIRLGKGTEPYYWSELSAKLKLNELHEKVSSTRIILSTQATFSASLDILKFKHFRTLVVDEASQLIEPQLVGILPHFERFIMIGDDNQLPPVVLQNESETRCNLPDLNAIGLVNYRDPLFTRLLYLASKNGWDDCHEMLTEHYRMHEQIAEFPNENFYEGKLRAGTGLQRVPLDVPKITSSLMHVFAQSRIVFIPTRRDMRSKLNDNEAKLVAELVKTTQEIYGSDFSAKETVGVITPFRAQIANIKQHLPRELQDISVDTVERYQGSERDVIILSFAVKSDVQLFSIQSINAAGVDRKLNVALTRAKKHLILLGCEEVLSKNPVFRKLIQHIKASGGYIHTPYEAAAVAPDIF